MHLMKSWSCVLLPFILFFLAFSDKVDDGTKALATSFFVFTAANVILNHKRNRPDPEWETEMDLVFPEQQTMKPESA